MLDMRVRKLFFDRPRVMRAVDRGKRSALSRIGGWIRKTARRSMRRRKRASRPGEPPSAHTGLLRDGTFYSFDPSSESVVIGPVRMKRQGTDVPQVLEHGGISTVTRLRGGKVHRRRVKIEARPYMGPALEKAMEADVIPEAFRGSVKGG